MVGEEPEALISDILIKHLIQIFRFEIIIAENEASIIALSNRLAQSNTDVEKLQDELKHSEDCICEYKDLLSVMRSNNQLVEEQIQTYMKGLDTQRELVDKYETNNLSQFKSIKSIFETKIETLKQEAAKEITRLQNDCEQKSLLNDEVIVYLLLQLILRLVHSLCGINKT